ncbi:MAG TPA: L-2-amino-thiazoline-4-carboxylic acid hydrolase, partial [Aestuariivirga sp.]
MAEIPTIVKRKLQAQVIGPIYAEMVAQVGEERATAILDAAIRKAAIAEGMEFAKKAPGGVTSMADFIKLYELWTADGALEVTVHEATDKTFNFDVT